MSRTQGQDVLQLWKEGPFGRELSRTQEVQPLWQEGSFSKRLLGEASEIVEEAKVGEGRGRGNKFRNVEGEEEDEEQDEDYEDEGEPESDDVEHPEPESEDPSGPVNQINQMTMCVWEASDCGSLKLEY